MSELSCETKVSRCVRFATVGGGGRAFPEPDLWLAGVEGLLALAGVLSLGSGNGRLSEEDVFDGVEVYSADDTRGGGTHMSFCSMRCAGLPLDKIDCTGGPEYFSTGAEYFSGKGGGGGDCARGLYVALVFTVLQLKWLCLLSWAGARPVCLVTSVSRD